MRKAIPIAVVLFLMAAIIMALSIRQRHGEYILENLKNAAGARLGIPFWPVMPAEFYVFDRLQRVRDLGFLPVWKERGYVLVDTSDNREFDPFEKWKNGHYRRDSLTTNHDHWFKDLFYPHHLLYQSSDPLPSGSRYSPLYYQELYGERLVLRDGRLAIVNCPKKEDEVIPLEQILLRDEAVGFNLHSKLSSHYYSHEKFALLVYYAVGNESVLKSYGWIARREAGSYFPTDLEMGKPADLPPKDGIPTEAVRIINEAAAKYGRDFFTTIGFARNESWSRGEGPEFEAICLLDLYKTSIHWNETAKQYELGK